MLSRICSEAYEGGDGYHLGYEKSERSDNDDYRNGYKFKRINNRYDHMEILIPQDRQSIFQPQVVGTSAIRQLTGYLWFCGFGRDCFGWNRQACA